MRQGAGAVRGPPELARDARRAVAVAVMVGGARDYILERAAPGQGSIGGDGDRLLAGPAQARPRDGLDRAPWQALRQLERAKIGRRGRRDCAIPRRRGALQVAYRAEQRVFFLKRAE